MKVKATDILKKKAYQYNVTDPLAGGPKRVTKLAELEAAALDFATDVLFDYDLPSAPQITLGASNGFENVQKDLNEVVGTITVYASFKSLSGTKIRLDLPIPICRGNFNRPSIAIINGKKHVLSQEMLDRLLARHETVIPETKNPFGKDKHITHQENIKRDLFDAPPNQGLYYFDPMFTY